MTIASSSAKDKQIPIRTFLNCGRATTVLFPTMVSLDLGLYVPNSKPLKVGMLLDNSGLFFLVKTCTSSWFLFYVSIMTDNLKMTVLFYIEVNRVSII